MNRKFKILSENEIKTLNEEKLKEYFNDLQEYKKELLDNLNIRKKIFKKIEAFNIDKDVKTQIIKDQEEIQKIRQEISNL